MVIPAACRVLMSARMLGAINMTDVEVDSALDAMVGVLEAWATRSAFIGEHTLMLLFKIA